MQLIEQLDQCVFQLAGAETASCKVQLRLEFKKPDLPSMDCSMLSVVAHCALAPKQLLARLKGELYADRGMFQTDPLQWMRSARAHYQIFTTEAKWAIEGMLFGAKDPEDNRTDEQIIEEHNSKPDLDFNYSREEPEQHKQRMLKHALKHERQLEIQHRGITNNNEEVFPLLLSVGQACIDEAESIGWSGEILPKGSIRTEKKTKQRTGDIIFDTAPDFVAHISIMGNKEYDDFLEESGLDALSASSLLR